MTKETEQLYGKQVLVQIAPGCQDRSRLDELIRVLTDLATRHPDPPPAAAQAARLR